jgi:cytochrome c oxidase assembly protein subunit 11
VSGKTRTLVLLGGLMALMVGLVAASVPLYTLFCRVTGYAGTPRIAERNSSVASRETIEVRFDGDVMKDMPWRFAPDRRSLTVRLGETTLATFHAENLSNEPITGTATFNVMPAKAATYVDKIQCFCFTEQHLAAGEMADLPVTFYIDPAIAKDPQTNDVHTITLSYTFFKARTSPTSAPAARNTGNASPVTAQPKEGKS